MITFICLSSQLTYHIDKCLFYVKLTMKLSMTLSLAENLE